MRRDVLNVTFLFEIDVFQKRSVFNILIRGAHYGTPRAGTLAPRASPHIFVYFCLFGEILFFDKCALF